MQINKEVIAVTLLAMLTAAVIAIIVLVSEEALSSEYAAASPTPVSPSRVVGVNDSRVKDFSLDHQEEKTNNSLLSGSTKTQAMFIIGDSSVDCGKNSLFYPLLRSNLSMFPCSNGSGSSLIPQFLATKMGLSDIPSFYEQNGTVEGILNGLNFGSAGATILTSPISPRFQSLNQQLRQTFETIQLLQLQLGEAEAARRLNSSVFYVSFGKEDFINFLFQNVSFIPDFETASRALWQLLANEMKSTLKSLYNVGARKIITMGVLPLGCAPMAVTEWYIKNGSNNRGIMVCVREINQLVTQFNQRLSENIIALNLESSGAQFVYCDVNQGLMEIISDPQRYGFDNVRGTCCGRGLRGAALGCQSTSIACGNISSHVWWDMYNPTHTVNSLLADSVWSGQPLGGICHPQNFQNLVGALHK